MNNQPSEQKLPIAVVASQTPPRVKPSIYPEPFASRMAGRVKHPLGDLFGLSNFGVNLVRLKPGAGSALRHAHAKQDEFVYIVQGDAVLITDADETQLTTGMCAGFKFGTGNGHQLLNLSNEEVTYIEVGDRSVGDTVVYPDDNLQAAFVDDKWKFTDKKSLTRLPVCAWLDKDGRVLPHEQCKGYQPCRQRDAQPQFVKRR
jgi:uncharacterized cupin superfamily protein